jgi:microcystin-dependent protein
MAYVPTTWVETGMSTVDKVNGLNNLETIYTSAISAIDAIGHSERYYTKTEANSKYFTAATDGSGSGMIAAKLDGWTALQIINSGTPAGCIGMWHSTIESIPAGWYLCNGLNSTPDMRDRFPVGAGGNYDLGDIGGSNSVTASAASVTIGGHVLTAAEIPKHTHGTIPDWYGTGSDGENPGPSGSTPVADGVVVFTRVDTANAGGGESHTHTGSFAGTTDKDKRPPFHALAFIMKGAV